MTNERDGRVRPFEDSETMKNKEEVLKEEVLKEEVCFRLPICRRMIDN